MYRILNGTLRGKEVLGWRGELLTHSQEPFPNLKHSPLNLIFQQEAEILPEKVLKENELFRIVNVIFRGILLNIFLAKLII